MSADDSAFAYHQSTAFGASAVGQVIALYGTILRDFHRAMAAISAGKIEKRVNALNHALIVVGELQGVLDYKRGDEAARNLSDFYTVARALITQASMTGSAEKLQELIGMFTRIRSAWAKAEQTIGASEPTQRLRISSEAHSGFSQNAPAGPENSSDSNGGRWSA
jgi:flagellar biosynthetic protein FliS